LTTRGTTGWAIVLFAAWASAACGGTTSPTPAVVPLDVTIEPFDPTDSTDTRNDDVRRANAAEYQARQQGRHGALPPLERREPDTSPDAWPSVTIVNDTPHALVVWFAGPCARTVGLGPSAEHRVEVCEGTYEIAAELSSDDYLPFVGQGDDLESGYAYSLTFYVVAEPTQRRRR
jgi:hypothetical protein